MYNYEKNKKPLLVTAAEISGRRAVFLYKKALQQKRIVIR